MCRVVFGLGLWCAAVETADAVQPNAASGFLLHHWDSDGDLPCTTINTVIRTDDGYAWLGTVVGLVRFDGIRFVTFNAKNTPALKDDRINALAVDHQGILWAGSSSGTLTKNDHGVFSSVNLGIADSAQPIRSLTVDTNGNLWVARAGIGLLKLKNGRVEKIFTITNGLPSLELAQVLADGQGRVWYVTTEGKLGWVEGEQAHIVDQPDFICTLALAHDGGLWLADYNRQRNRARILKFKDGRITEETQPYPWSQGSPRSRIGALLEDRSGNLWCGTWGEGVFVRLAGGEWQKLSTADSLSQAEVLHLAEDEGGSIWITTRNYGLHQAVLSPLTAFHLPDADGQNVLLTACVRQDGSIWGGTDGAGVFRWQESGTNYAGEPRGLAGVWVNALFEDSRSNFWAGTGNGLYFFDNGQFEPVANSLLRKNITALFEDRQGRLLIGTAEGLLQVEAAGQTAINLSQGLPSGPIIAIAQDHTDRLWVVVKDNGVFRQNGNAFERWLPQAGKRDARQRWDRGEFARTLLCDRAGRIWCTTFGFGVFCLSENLVRAWIWERDELPSNHNFAMLEDAAGNLWFSSEMGLFGYSQKALLDYADDRGPLPVPFRLTTADGLPHKICTGFDQPTAMKSADGRCWFPDGAALVAFHPIAVTRNLEAWRPIIEELRVDNVPTVIVTNQPIKIASGARSFEFFFTSPNMLSPESLHFRYQLKNFDKDWSPEGLRRSVQYGHLPPGNYTFQVMTRNNDGKWNQKTAALQLTIVPQFWETAWFQALAGIILLGGVVLAVRQRERARSRRKLAILERERALEQERARIARDIHDDLGANLTQVALLGDMAGEAFGSPDELRAQTRQISLAAREMTQSLEAIVWAVRPENDNLRGLIEYMNRRTDELFEKMPRQYHFIVPAELPICSIHAEVRHNVFLTYKEALTNSLKHAAAKNVHIEIICDAGECRITIIDDGKGFDQANTRAGGNGLKNMRQRMQEIGGRFELTSQSGKGSTVRLAFPIAAKP